MSLSGNGSPAVPHAVFGIDGEVAEGISDVVPVELARNHVGQLLGLNGYCVGYQVQQEHQSGNEAHVSVHHKIDFTLDKIVQRPALKV